MDRAGGRAECQGLPVGDGGGGGGGGGATVSNLNPYRMIQYMYLVSVCVGASPTRCRYNRAHGIGGVGGAAEWGCRGKFHIFNCVRN